MPKSEIRFRFSLAKAEKRVKKLVGHFDGSQGEQVSEVLAQVGDEVRNIILAQYVSTYSQHPRVVAMRTYKLEDALNYVDVVKVGKYGWGLKVTKDTLWPLGSGPLSYAEVQELGGITNWKLLISARDFLLAGVNAIAGKIEPALEAAYERWISEE